MENVSLIYTTIEGETKALEDLSFQVNEGEFISIVGPSGCGKTTILSLIAGLLKPTSGKILIDQQEVKYTSSQIGYMLQQDYLFNWRTIEENVMLGLEIQNKKTNEFRLKVKEMIHAYGLAEFAKYYPAQLSGGMRQRVALARTLAINPEILLLDEPFSALDYQTRIAIADEVGKILRQENKTTILVTHDIAEAISMSDRIIIISKRPGTVKSDYSIDLSCTERSPLKSREAPEFRGYFKAIWEELDVHV